MPLLVSVAAVVVLDPSVVLGATVKGKVINTHKLLNPVWIEAAGLAKDEKTHRFTFREPVSTVPLEARQLTGHFSKELCLVALTEGNAAPKPKPLRLVIEGGRTSLVTLVVASGQEIRFENHDPTPHAIYEVTGQHGLSKATMEPEAVRSWTPPGPGKYELRDELSPSLRSWIVVEPRAAEVFFPNKGEFAINLEPGKYTLQAYYSGDPVGTAMPFEVTMSRPSRSGPRGVNAATTARELSTAQAPNAPRRRSPARATSWRLPASPTLGLATPSVIARMQKACRPSPLTSRR